MTQFLNILKAIILGIPIGFVMAIPLGPAGIEAVKRTISKGFKEGYTVSIGTVTANVVYMFLINCGLVKLLSNNKLDGFFWIVCGNILIIIGYKSVKNISNEEEIKSNKMQKLSSSMPFTAGFIITFTNPMTLSLWLFLSGTVIHPWYYLGLGPYYTFIISLIIGFILWVTLLNYLASKGIKMLNPSNSMKTQFLLMVSILIIGIVFVIYGFIKFFKFV